MLGRKICFLRAFAEAIGYAASFCNIPPMRGKKPSPDPVTHKMLFPLRVFLCHLLHQLTILASCRRTQRQQKKAQPFSICQCLFDPLGTTRTRCKALRVSFLLQLLISISFRSDQIFSCNIHQLQSFHCECVGLFPIRRLRTHVREHLKALFEIPFQSLLLYALLKGTIRLRFNTTMSDRYVCLSLHRWLLVGD